MTSHLACTGLFPDDLQRLEDRMPARNDAICEGQHRRRLHLRRHLGDLLVLDVRSATSSSATIDDRRRPFGALSSHLKCLAGRHACVRPWPADHGGLLLRSGRIAVILPTVARCVSRLGRHCSTRRRSAERSTSDTARTTSGNASHRAGPSDDADDVTTATTATTPSGAIGGCVALSLVSKVVSSTRELRTAARVSSSPEQMVGDPADAGQVAEEPHAHREDPGQSFR
jgi:hypothetical protein